MVQLRVYTDSTRATQQYIDLYETEPIKLNLSIEDITNAEASSVFSRTFRVPATGNNNKFFKHAFLIEGVDYDVTIKKPAEVLVDGAEFRVGHIRLQKIYNNKESDRIDYEIVFLGETKDFSSQIGDAPICQLNIPSINHVVNRTNVIESWNAYPQSASATAGLVNGDVLYPLIDHGNVYPINNSNPRISFEGSHTFHNNPLPMDRMKPMIRAKAIWDQIFEDAGYSYTSEFIDPASGDPNIFTQLYVSAFGNEASPINDLGASTGTFEAYSNDVQRGDDNLYFPNVVTNPSGNFNVGNPQAGSTYTASDPGLHQVEVFVDLYYGEDDREDRNAIDAEIQLWNTRFPLQPIAVSAPGYGTSLSLSHNANLQTGDVLTVVVAPADPNDEFDYSEVDSPRWSITQAPGQSQPTFNMDCEYKQIDFVKDILTTFRLVMSPDPKDATNFIIEPWVDYITGGDLYDWSHKLVEDKDQIIEPLFFTQSDQIQFSHKEGGDWLNKYHKDAYGNSYGYLEFDSGNELLVGSRKIQTNWAPTPMTQIEGVDNTSPFVIPQIHAHVEKDGATEHLPIKPKTRFLFYTGLHDVGANQNTWELGNSMHLDEFPLVAYSDTWPLVSGSTILNWRNDVGYWGSNVDGYPPQSGQSLYNLYWGPYINSLYSKFARRMTAYFVLNNVDLQQFSFDDVIFVNGSYYRVEKIIDAQIGERMPTKVQLIKLLNYAVPRVPPKATLSLTTGYADVEGPCDDTTVANSVVYYPELAVGQVIGSINITGSVQYFRILGSTEAGFDKIGWTIAIQQDGTVQYLVNYTCPEPVDPCDEATPTSFNVQMNQASTPTTNDGSIYVTPVGGIGPWEVTLEENGIEIFNIDGVTSQVFLSNLGVGTYEVIVDDSCGVTDTQTVTVTASGTDPNDPCDTATPTAFTASATQASGPTATDGTVTVNPTGGLSPWVISLYQGTTLIQTYTGVVGQVIFNNLGVNNYEVRVTDACNDLETSTINVTNGGAGYVPMELSTTKVDVLCRGTSTGSVNLTVADGQAPYTYSWDNGETTQDISNLPAGTYMVTVTDNTSATETITVTITEPGSALFVFNTVQDQNITVTASGGVAPYSILWYDGETTFTRTGNWDTSYTYTVTDANGCEVNQTAIVGSEPAPIDRYYRLDQCSGGPMELILRSTAKYNINQSFNFFGGCYRIYAFTNEADWNANPGLQIQGEGQVFPYCNCSGAEGSISFTAAEPLIWDDITAGPTYAGTVIASGNWTLEPIPQPGGAPTNVVTVSPSSGSATGGQPIQAYYDGTGYGDDTIYTVNLRVNGVIVDSFTYYVGIE